MANVKCVRCSGESEALAKPPFNDDIGRKIHASICQRCWNEWMGMQIRIINEYRLSLGDPQAQKVLTNQMLSFLNLAG
jgi:Fe-S cluster biosynthesis and repair protein YggX